MSKYNFFVDKKNPFKNIIVVGRTKGFKNGYNIRGYYVTENFVFNLGCYFIPYLLVSTFLQ